VTTELNADSTRQDEGDDAAPVSETANTCGINAFQVPHIVTTEEAAAGTFCMDDVVLPLPGNDVIYPTNEIGDLYRLHLRNDGIEEVISKGHHVKEYTLSGAYRSLLARPRDLEWKILRHTDEREELSYTDLNKLQQDPQGSYDTGAHKSLQIDFTLPSATYATMMLREVMKTSTAASYHVNKEQTSNTVDNTNETLDETEA